MGKKIMNKNIMVDFDKPLSREGTHAEKYDAKLRKFGTNDVMPLWVADMDLAVSLAIQEALLKRIEHPIYGYTDYYDAYYNAIIYWMKKSHHFLVDREWILPLSSVVTGLSFAVDVFTKEGDGVIVQPPIYSPFYTVVTNQKREVLENELIIVEGAYQIDFEDFEAKAQHAKLFLFCSPHNPTGRVWRKEELTKLAIICKKYGVIIISDEVHADLAYTTKHIPIAIIEEAKEITITLNAPSKTFNIAGIASAYAIVENKKLREQFEVPLKRYALMHPNLLALTATITAYTQSDAWLASVKNYLQANLTYMKERLETMPKIKAMPTEATFLLWLDCTALNLSDDVLEKFFIEKAKLGLNSGVGFGKGGNGFMRFNFAVSHEKLVEAMDRLEAGYHNC
jgi:cystathionine beta-lyase